MEIRLYGVESVFWAVDHKHDPSRKTAYKSMVPGDKRREQANILIDVTRNLQNLSPMQMQTEGKIEVPFELPLPETLPSSFLYCGDMLSKIQVYYTLTCRLVGTEQVASMPPTPLYTINKIVTIRQRDPAPRFSITQEVEGKISGAFTSNGTCMVKGTLENDLVFQNFHAKLTLWINNSVCGKMVDNTTLSLHRTITCRGKAPSGETKEF